MADMPVIVTDNGVPTTFACVELAVKAGVEESVTVSVTELRPTVCGVNVDVEPVLLLNSDVEVVPLGLTLEKEKE